MGLFESLQVDVFKVVSHPCTDDKISFTHPTVRTKPKLSSVNKRVERAKICSKTLLKTSWFWFCCFLMADVFPCHVKWYFGGLGTRATRMLTRLEGFHLIVESMFLRLNYTGHSVLSSEKFTCWVWSELLNNGTIVAPSCPHGYWSSFDQCSYDDIQQTYLFIPPPVTWSHCWVDMFLSIIEFLRWSIRHTFPDHRLLHEELNAINRYAVKEAFCTHCCEGCFDWPNNCDTLCQISNSWWLSLRTFRVNLWMQCGMTSSCWLAPS